MLEPPRHYSILVVEDEPVARQRLLAHLENKGYRCHSTVTVAETLQALNKQRPDLVLLDIQLPDAMDFELARKIRQQTRCGLIIVTSLNEQKHCLQGLQVGADDYMVKPFDMQELLLKVHNLLQRLQPHDLMWQQHLEPMCFKDWVYHPMQFQLIHKNGLQLKVTKAEHELLMIFLKRPNRVISRDEIMGILADDSTYDRAIDSRISRLKKKIILEGDAKNLIQSIYGSGYIFNAQVDVKQVTANPRMG